VRSAEAIDGLRGKGANVAGFILDESGHWDLEYAWRSVILPILLDNGGWAIFNSSPNAGTDGNAEKRTPSFFNRLCQQVMNGERGDEWSHSHLTARDNPAIDKAGLAALIAEYPPESPQLAQEVEAKLITGGAGLAFPEWNAQHHGFAAPVSPDWAWFGGLDWGYTSPGCFLLAASGPDREILVRHELYFKGRTPFQVGESIGSILLGRGYGRAEWVSADSAMWAVTDGGESVAEGVQRGITSVMGPQRQVALVACPKGPGSRIAGKMLVHEGLKYDPANVKDGRLAPYHMPRLRVHTDCANLTRTLPALPLDEKNPEDVDTDAEDHAYDALRYALVMRQPETAIEVVPTFSRDHSPGFHKDWTRKRPQDPEYDERYAAELERAESRSFQTGYRWSDG
jgi:hypothetical protein